jgi:hypothetical protein
VAAHRLETSLSVPVLPFDAPRYDRLLARQHGRLPATQRLPPVERAEQHPIKGA